MGIADDLYFDVFRILQIFFKIYFIIAKGFFSFAFSHIVGSYGFFGAVNNAHTAAAAAVDCFNDDRITAFFAKGQYLIEAVYRALAAGNHGDACQLGLLTGVDFVTEHYQVLQTGADENQSFLSTAAS